jgi:murein DD-endopeptidase MepM/ murein hydrolase activator NlpD
MPRKSRVKISGGRKPVIVFAFPFILVLIAIGFFVYLNERETPQITLLNETELIGSRQEMSLTVSDSRSGIKQTEVLLRQDGREIKLAGHDFVRKGYVGLAGPDRVEENFIIDSSTLKLKDGQVELIVRARDFSLWHFGAGNEACSRYLFTLDTKPPRITRLDQSQYIKPGGSGVVVYKLSEEAGRHGVMVNGYFHPGFPLAYKGELVFGAMIGLPWNTAEIKSIYVEAEDQAGNTGKSPFGIILKKADYKRDRINISDNFLKRKLPEFTIHYPEMKGSLLDQYLYLNNTVRQANNSKFREVCSHSLAERQWDGRFGRMARSSNRAGYADQRSYYYQGKKVDNQTHLGIDLASVRHAEIKAANNGKVVYAEFQGIYGNTVILDHGQGVFSLYAHLSQIKVAPGDMVNKGDLIALSGATGMAGGDHLHFSILINGIFVDPREWWDSHWLEVNILSYLE